MSTHHAARETGSSVNGLTDQQQAALAERYSSINEARHLLGRAGFPLSRVPSFETPQLFWYTVSHRLAQGIMNNGSTQVLAIAAADFPDDPVLVNGADGGANSSPPPAPNPQPTPPPPPAPPPNPNGGQNLWRQAGIGAAIIGAVGAVVAAAVTGAFGLVGGNGDKPATIPTPFATGSASAAVLDLTDELSGRQLIGEVHQESMPEYSIRLEINDDAAGAEKGDPLGRSYYTGVSAAGNQFTCDNDLILSARSPLEARFIEQLRGQGCYPEDELRISRDSGGQLRFELWVTRPQQGSPLPTDHPFGTGVLRFLD